VIDRFPPAPAHHRTHDAHQLGSTRPSDKRSELSPVSPFVIRLDTRTESGGDEFDHISVGHAAGDDRSSWIRGDGLQEAPLSFEQTRQPKDDRTCSFAAQFRSCIGKSRH